MYMTERVRWYFANFYLLFPTASACVTVSGNDVLAVSGTKKVTRQAISDTPPQIIDGIPGQ